MARPGTADASAIRAYRIVAHLSWRGVEEKIPRRLRVSVFGPNRNAPPRTTTNRRDDDHHHRRPYRERRKEQAGTARSAAGVGNRSKRSSAKAISAYHLTEVAAEALARARAVALVLSLSGAAVSVPSHTEVCASWLPFRARGRHHREASSRSSQPHAESVIDRAGQRHQQQQREQYPTLLRPCCTSSGPGRGSFRTTQPNGGQY